jgi:microcin C transport system permease protein
MLSLTQGLLLMLPPVDSPVALAWQRFCKQRRAVVSLWLFLLLFFLTLGAEFLANDRPLWLYYQGKSYFPVLFYYPESEFGGFLETETDYRSAWFQDLLLAEAGSQIIFPLIPYHFSTIDYNSPLPHPAPPSAKHWLGTDANGRDVLARLIYGFRLSVWFALGLTALTVLLGIFFGAIQGYFAGRLDLFFQRFSEIWGSLPELYVLIILAAIFSPSALLLLLILAAFGWLGLSDYVRAEFLRARNFEYVRAARALGVSDLAIMFRHILPNALTPVLTFLPFRLSGAILALTSLDFLGLGLPPTAPSLGELLLQGKSYLSAWWLSLSAFSVLVITLLLLVFIGDGLRQALDPREGQWTRS